MRSLDLSYQILKRLGDGGWHSGQALGEHFGVSRAAVWKHLQQLQDAEVPVESIKGKGYRLAQPLELFSVEAIERQLAADTGLQQPEIELHCCTDSTNTQAMQRMVQRESGGRTTGEPLVVLAEQQLAGRGRRGKQWQSPLARNIYCSIGYSFHGGAAALSGLSLAVGIALVDALESLGCSELQLKWPNDLLWRERKLAGILIEMVGDAAGPCAAVVGFGINLAMSPGMREQIDQPAVDLQEIAGDRSIARNTVTARVIAAVINVLQGYEARGFSHYQQRWEQLDCWQGQQVEVNYGGTQVSGEHCGVDSEGSLKLKTAQGIEIHSGGEISLRKRAGG